MARKYGAISDGEMSLFDLQAEHFTKKYYPTKSKPATKKKPIKRKRRPMTRGLV